MHWREGIKKVSLWEAAVREAKGRLEKNPSGFFDLAAVRRIHLISPPCGARWVDLEEI
jgi:hypothetical protein